ncbi:MAG: carboxypeptidase regulatory-like domain-containing protein [Acidobacteria bacterium]|nr:carboxypeptidase regulatory-like domain-containing protein [Acidobacteriota bacterium]
MRRILLALASLTAILVGVPAAAQSGTFITGTVTSELGAGIGGICVEGMNIEYGRDNTARTASDGTYALQVNAGDLRVNFWDCNDEPSYLPEWYDNAPDWESATVLQIADGETRSNVDAALTLGGSVTGTVTGEGAGGVDAICASVVDPAGSEVSWGLTDAAGRYRIGVLRAGSYKVHFSDGHCGWAVMLSRPAGMNRASEPPRVGFSSARAWPPGGWAEEWFNDKPDFASADAVPVAEGVETPGIDAVLAPGGWVDGRVTNVEGDPIPDACVFAYHVTGEPAGWVAWADRQGEYLLGGLRSGQYKIEFAECGWSWTYESVWFDGKASFARADPVSVVQGAPAPGVDATLPRHPSPDFAITEISVSDVPLQTAYGALVPTGWTRRVDVHVANIGTAEGTSPIEAWVTSSSDQERAFLGYDYLTLPAGGSGTVSVPWNGFGTIGDVVVQGRACPNWDRVYWNNHATVSHYVLVGGSGFGVTVLSPFAPGYPWGSPCEDYMW